VPPHFLSWQARSHFRVAYKFAFYSIQFRFWPLQLHQHLHLHSTYYLGSRTYPLPPDLHWHQYLHWGRSPARINYTKRTLVRWRQHLLCSYFWWRGSVWFLPAKVCFCQTWGLNQSTLEKTKYIIFWDNGISSLSYKRNTRRNVDASCVRRWKKRGRLPIGDNWTF